MHENKRENEKKKKKVEIKNGFRSVFWYRE